METSGVWLLVLATAALSSVFTAALAALLFRLKYQQRLDTRLEALGQELEARVRSGVLSAGEELAPRMRREVELGFRDGVMAIASGSDLDESVRAFAKGSMDLIGGGIDSLLGRPRKR